MMLIQRLVSVSFAILLLGGCRYSADKSGRATGNTGVTPAAAEGALSSMPAAPNAGPREQVAAPTISRGNSPSVVNPPKKGTEQTDSPSKNRVAEEEVTFQQDNLAGAVPIVFSPRDLTTSLGIGTIEVHLPTGQQGGSALDVLAAHVSLRTWPEMELVPSTTREIEYAPQIGSKSMPVPFAHVRVIPTAPLADRWYIVCVDSGAKVIAADRNVVKLAQGGIGARFRMGSQIAVRDFRDVVTNGTEHNLIIEFTERVKLSDRSLTAVTNSGRGCPIDVPGFGNSDNSAIAAVFKCGSISASDVSQFTFALDGIVGMDGHPVTAVPPATAPPSSATVAAAVAPSPKAQLSPGRPGIVLSTDVPAADAAWAFYRP